MPDIPFSASPDGGGIRKSLARAFSQVVNCQVSGSGPTTGPLRRPWARGIRTVPQIPCMQRAGDLSVPPHFWFRARITVGEVTPESRGLCEGGHFPFPERSLKAFQSI